MCGVLPPLVHKIFMGLCLFKHRKIFSFVTLRPLVYLRKKRGISDKLCCLYNHRFMKNYDHVRAIYGAETLL
jgi:hypothetical protein